MLALLSMTEGRMQANAGHSSACWADDLRAEAEHRLADVSARSAPQPAPKPPSR